MSLSEERNSSSFNVSQLTEYLYGKNHTLRQELLELIESNPVYDQSNTYYMSREELREDSMKKEIVFVLDTLRLGLDMEGGQLFNSLAVKHLPVTGLHWAMFVPTIQSQASEEQAEKWLPLAMTLSIIGTYAQTELGHGSNLKSIETTAVYDVEKQEFVLNTPYLSSMKWWPGALGKDATHCIVMARLIIRDKDYGFHSFIMQVRDLDDHTTLPGITLGDIGPKEGDWNVMGNGRMELKDVRIPRENMLMKHSKVSKEGEYTKPPHSKLKYSSMSLIRASIVDSSSGVLSKAITIAIRYSCVRVQGYLLGEKSDTESELKILDYGSQQSSLFPILAESYALHFTAKYMWKLYYDSVEKIQEGDYSVLPEFHATTSGLKAICTWIAVAGAEESRQRCGGHGFLRSAGIADIYMNALPSCTYEGDNLVLCQQAARYLMKAAQSSFQGNEQHGNVEYLNDLLTEENHVCLAKNTKDLLDSDIQLNAFRRLACLNVLQVFQLQQRELEKGINRDKVWNIIMPTFKELTEAHCLVIIARSFINAVKDSPTNFSTPLKNLCDLFSLYYLSKLSSILVLNGYFTKTQVFWIKQEILELLGKIRQDAVPLVDAWDHRDYMLNSVLGNYDGNVYESLYEASKKSSLNKSDIVPAYEKYIRPLFQKASL